MVNIAMHIMDIAQNSVRAEASLIEIELKESNIDYQLEMIVRDNACGMDAETVANLSDPFFTSRTTRKVGLGIPFLKMSCEQTEGTLSILSEKGKGTEVRALFHTNHPDCLPLGDLGGYISLLMSANAHIEIAFCYQIDNEKFEISKSLLASEGIDDLSSGAMVMAIKSYINENLKTLYNNRNRDSYLC